MVLTQEFEGLVHLIARAFARTHGQVDSAETYAGTVVEHAKAIVAEDAAKVVAEVKPAAETVASAPAAVPEVAAPVAAAPAVLPPGDQPAAPAQPAA